MKYFTEYLLYQIANAPIRKYPWTHVLFDRIFHPIQYQQIINNLPNTGMLTDIRDIHFHPPGYPAKRFILHDYSKLPHSEREYWEGIKRQFTDGKLKEIILSKFATEICGCNSKEQLQYVEFYDTFQLTMDKSGYILEPHPDALGKIFTIVINLPSDNNSDDMGTVIYNSSSSSDVVYRSEYKPNTGFGVFRSDDSWHGVEETKSDRWTIQYTVWVRNKK